MTLIVVIFSGVLLLHCANTMLGLLLVAPRYPFHAILGFFVMFPSPLMFKLGTASALLPVSVNPCAVTGPWKIAPPVESILNGFSWKIAPPVESILNGLAPAALPV